MFLRIPILESSKEVVCYYITTISFNFNNKSDLPMERTSILGGGKAIEYIVLFRGICGIILLFCMEGNECHYPNKCPYIPNKFRLVLTSAYSCYTDALDLICQTHSLWAGYVTCWPHPV